MGKLIEMKLKVIKPDLCREAMCIYKFTLDTGFYYFGATTDLDDRVCCHLKAYRNNRQTKAIMEAMNNAAYIKFEFVRFVNNKKDLRKWEEYYLSKNVGLPKCLNQQDYSSKSHVRNECLNRIAKVDKEGKIITIYLSLSEAAIQNCISVHTIVSNCNSKYPVTKTYYRRINEEGEILNPSKPVFENPSGRKKVRQYDKQMNFIKEYNSISDAGRAIGCDRKNVSDILRGKAKTANGFIFREVDKEGLVIPPTEYNRKPRNKDKSNPKKIPKKPIKKIDLSGDVVETYSSLYMAIKNVPIDRRSLTKVLKRNITYKGFFYKYA